MRLLAPFLSNLSPAPRWVSSSPLELWSPPGYCVVTWTHFQYSPALPDALSTLGTPIYGKVGCATGPMRIYRVAPLKSITFITPLTLTTTTPATKGRSEPTCFEAGESVFWTLSRAQYTVPLCFHHPRVPERRLRRFPTRLRR